MFRFVLAWGGSISYMTEAVPAGSGNRCVVGSIDVVSVLTR